MVNMTLSIPDELHKKMKKFSEIRWSEIARKAIQQRVENLEEMNRITSRSRFTQKEIEELSKKVKRGIAIKHGIK